jgi:hypothetical protein
MLGHGARSQERRKREGLFCRAREASSHRRARVVSSARCARAATLHVSHAAPRATPASPLGASCAAPQHKSSAAASSAHASIGASRDGRRTRAMARSPLRRLPVSFFTPGLGNGGRPAAHARAARKLQRSASRRRRRAPQRRATRARPGGEPRGGVQLRGCAAHRVCVPRAGWHARDRARRRGVHSCTRARRRRGRRRALILPLSAVPQAAPGCFFPSVRQ